MTGKSKLVAATKHRRTKPKKLPTVGNKSSVRIGSSNGNNETIRFGSVTISAKKISSAVAQRNIFAGQVALWRAAEGLATPGVSLGRKKDIPLFSVDESNPDILVRKLNGKTERGILKDGRFEVVG